MKRAIVIALLSTVLITSTPLQQLLKLPVLVQHFYEHQQEDKSIGFLEYITQHYFNGEDKDADYRRDQQLPFKSLDVPTSLAITALPLYTEKSVIAPAENAKAALILHDEEITSAQYLSSIWQPPKQC